MAPLAMSLNVAKRLTLPSVFFFFVRFTGSIHPTWGAPTVAALMAAEASPSAWLTTMGGFTVSLSAAAFAII